MCPIVHAEIGGDSLTADLLPRVGEQIANVPTERRRQLPSHPGDNQRALGRTILLSSDKSLFPTGALLFARE